MGLAAFNRNRLKQAELAKQQEKEKPVGAKEEKEPQNTAKKKKAAK